MKKRSLWLRIPAALLAVGLIVLLAVMTMAFTGDPISAYRADQAAKKYVIASDTYRTMNLELTDAEAALEGVRIKVPDEVTEEICEVCGKNMVIKMGRFGKFLA